MPANKSRLVVNYVRVALPVVVRLLAVVVVVEPIGSQAARQACLWSAKSRNEGKRANCSSLDGFLEKNVAT